jgi:hypothetical protein
MRGPDVRSSDHGLSKRWTKLLVRKRRLKVAIAVSSKSQAHSARASTRSITIKAPKRST